MSEDKTFRHIKRISPKEFLEGWKSKNIRIPELYVIEHLEFDKFCRDNNWTFTEGLSLWAEELYDQEQKALTGNVEKLKKFKE